MTRLKKVLEKALISYGRLLDKIALKFIEFLITDAEHPGTQLGFNLLTLGSIYLGIVAIIFEPFRKEPSVFTGLLIFGSTIISMICFLSGFTLLRKPRLYEKLKRE